MLALPNSAPDSFAPTHWRRPDVDVLPDAAAVLDEELGTDAVEGAIVLVANFASCTLVGEVVMELGGVARGSTAEEEVGAGTMEEVEGVADDTIANDNVETDTEEEKTMLLEWVASWAMVSGSGNFVSRGNRKVHRSMRGPPGSHSHSSSRSLSTGAENTKTDKPAASKEVEKRMMLKNECTRRRSK